MAVNMGLAHLSDALFTTAIATYSLAMACYTAEYAFGRRGRVAATSRAEARVLVGAGGPSVEEPVAEPPARPSTRRAAGERLGPLAVVLTVLGAAIHLGSIALRGIAL